MSGSNEVVTDIDRISNLPEDVIGVILSYLPTTCAVATSVLAKSWRYKWTFINRIGIFDPNPWGEDFDDSVFVKYVERTLLLVKNAKRIKLTFFSQSLDRLESWLNSLSRHTVEDLDLDIYHQHYLYSADEQDYFSCDIEQDYFVLSSSLLNLTKLRRLVLIVRTFTVSSENQFPNLTIMRLQGVYVKNQNVGDDYTLIFTFPVLETLHLEDCKWFNVDFVEINAPALNNLLIRSDTTVYSEGDHCTISIHSAKLAEVKIDDLLENILLNGSTVVSASFISTYIFHEHEIVLLMSGVKVRSLLLQMSSSLKYLRMSASAIKAILASKQGYSYPLVKLDKLEELCLSSFTYSLRCGTETLFMLLHVVPSLKVLSIDLLWTDFKYDENVIESVPSCIASSLEEVRLYQYSEDRSCLGLEELLQQAGVRIKKFPRRFCHYGSF